MNRVVADLVARSLLCTAIALSVAAALQRPLASEEPTVPIAALGTWTCHGFVETDHIPLRPGQTFVWRAYVGDRPIVSWREELTVPAPPREWIGGDFLVVDGGRTALTQRTVEVEGGFVEHAWTITEGDPAGPYRIRLWIDGELVDTFHFEVR